MSVIVGLILLALFVAAVAAIYHKWPAGFAITMVVLNAIGIFMFLGEVISLEQGAQPLEIIRSVFHGYFGILLYADIAWAITAIGDAG